MTAREVLKEFWCKGVYQEIVKNARLLGIDLDEECDLDEEYYKVVGTFKRS